MFRVLRAVLVFCLIFAGVLQVAGATSPLVSSSYLEAYLEAGNYAIRDSILISNLKPSEVYQASVDLMARHLGIEPPRLSTDSTRARQEAADFFKKNFEYLRNDREKEVLFYIAVKGLLYKWDPWMHVLSPTDIFLNDYLSGLYLEGDGIFFVISGDYAKVVRVLEDMGGAKAGVKVGDLIVAINGIRIPEITDRVEYKIEREARKTGKIRYSILRESKVFELDVSYARRIQPYVISELLPDGVGYIALLTPGFTIGTGHEIVDALETLSAKGANAFIVDLRSNPGGLSWEMQIAISAFKKGPLYSLRYRNRIQIVEGLIEDPSSAPLAIVVDSNTASAAEVFAFVVRNRPKTRIFGSATSRTYGKALGQSSYQLVNGWVFRFTTVQIFDISGESFDRIGVKVDEVVKIDSSENLTPFDYSIGQAMQWLKLQNK